MERSEELKAGKIFQMTGSFDALTPERIFTAAETAMGARFSGVLMPLPSYINRVYEMERADDGSRFVFKFYRPGRWSRAALLEEHLFTLECRAAEIPVIAPLRLGNGSTLAVSAEGVFFAAFPKRWGRAFEAVDDESWVRLGTLLGRLHAVGCRRAARHRVRLEPRCATLDAAARLLAYCTASGSVRRELESVLKTLLRELFSCKWAPEMIRLHGDCHKGNILERPGEGLMLIDFDDMLTGPPVQDLWLLLPGPPDECGRELELLLRGYESIREFDRASLGMIEPLRAMRMIYFLDWCARQKGDFNFHERYPEWGGDGFWRRECASLREQTERIFLAKSVRW